MTEEGIKHMIYLSNHSTRSGYDVAVYQLHDSKSEGLISVAWKVMSLGKAETTPYVGHIKWKTNYMVGLMESMHSGKVKLAATLGSNYEVVLENGFLQIRETNKYPHTSGQISIYNNTGQPHAVGFTMGGRILAHKKINGGEKANFIATQTYYVAAYYDIHAGSPDIYSTALKAVPVEFKDGYNTATLSIEQVGDVVKINGPTFNQRYY